MVCVFCLGGVMFFFFSSRRRHTRFKCDWSSDVCSSDLFREHEGTIEFSEEPKSWMEVGRGWRKTNSLCLAMPSCNLLVDLGLQRFFRIISAEISPCATRMRSASGRLAWMLVSQRLISL